MKIIRKAPVAALIAILCIITLFVSGCVAGASSTIANQSTVSRGDLTVKVNGNGKLSYASDIKLTFGTAGQIVKLAVKKGDKIAKGTILAQLETTNLELALSQAKTAESATKAAITQAEMGVTQAQLDVTQAESSVTQAGSAKTQAEVSLSAARMNLEKTQAVQDIKDKITKAQWQIEIARTQMTTTNQTLARDNQFWEAYMRQYQADVSRYQDDLAKLLAKDAYAGIATYEIAGLNYDRMVVEDARMKEKQVESAQQAVDMAQQNIDKTKENIQLSQQQARLSQQNVDQANLALVQAAKAVAAAQKQLDFATITAPFDGYIADLSLKLNDFMAGPGVPGGGSIYMVDLSSIEIDTNIDEIDVADVQVGQPAVIQMDAITGNTFDGSVNSISLIPAVNTQNPGMVEFSVKVGFSQNPPLAAKSGMSASVDIITHEKKGVILVPNKSIKRNGQGKTIINVVNGEKLEDRQVTLGLSDGTNTEVIGGLQEGERIIAIASDSVKSG